MIRLKESRFKLIIAMLVILILLGGFILITSSPAEDADKQAGTHVENQDEESVIVDDYSIVIEEAKSFVGGAWFNRDSVFFLPAQLIIRKTSLFSGIETTIVPYTKVKKVEFITGHKLYKVCITYDDGSFIMRGSVNIILTKESSFKLAQSNIAKKIKDQVPIIEKASFCMKIYAVIEYFGGKKKN